MIVRKEQELLRQFRDARDWQRYHTPKNLVMALCGEVGELAACLQWKTDDECRHMGEHEYLRDELADVMIYLLQICDVMGVDIEREVNRKITINAIKYPIDNHMKT
jgi:NTP pyrophosphatase (non-canonical NTP hydrolase)